MLQTSLPVGTLTSVSHWLQEPFSGSMSAASWVLFLGLVVCAVVLWTRVLNHIVKDI